MESFADLLAVGGKTNSLGRASDVIEITRANPSRLKELFGCIYDDDAWVRMRAIDSFEKIIREHSAWVEPFLGRIFNELTASDQPSIQWHVAQLFTEINLNDEQQTCAIRWLKDKLKTTDVDWIVAVNAMKALLHFYRQGLVTSSDLEKLFAVQAGHKSKAVRAKATKLKLQFVNQDDLPYIGSPATSALVTIGVTKASQLKDFTEKDLLAIHGIGPKAIRLLKEAGVKLKNEDR